MTFRFHSKLMTGKINSLHQRYLTHVSPRFFIIEGNESKKKIIEILVIFLNSISCTIRNSFVLFFW